LEAPEGQQAAVEATGLDYSTAKHGWRVIQHEDGSRDSVFWKAPDLPDDTLERIRDAFEGLTPAEPVTPPEKTIDSLLTLYPVFDMHLGMHAWGRETGGPDYDVKIATRELKEAFEEVMAITPDSREAILVLGGDTLHANDDSAQTPASKHSLDVDGRHFKVIESAIDVLGYIIPRLQSKHDKVTVRVLRGNHDPNSHLVLTFALHQRYRNDATVEIEREPRDLFMRQWGKCGIFLHHGDKRKPHDMVMLLADACDFWSDTKHRYYFAGHLHHDHAKDYPGIRFEQLRAFCPPDAYGAMFGGRRTLQSITFDAEKGMRVRALDPIS
jgi:hypothetical protein